MPTGTSLGENLAHELSADLLEGQTTQHSSVIWYLSVVFTLLCWCQGRSLFQGNGLLWLTFAPMLLGCCSRPGLFPELWQNNAATHLVSFMVTLHALGFQKPSFDLLPAVFLLCVVVIGIPNLPFNHSGLTLSRCLIADKIAEANCLWGGRACSDAGFGV